MNSSAKQNFWQVGTLFVAVLVLLIVIYQAEIAVGMGEIPQIVVQYIIIIPVFWAVNYYWIKQPIRIAPQVGLSQLTLISLPFLILAIYVIGLSFQPHSAHTFALGLAAGVGAGFFEEYIFRGIIFAKLLQSFPNLSKAKTIWAAVIISSLLFGLMHGSNFFLQSFSTTMNQILFAIMLGLLLVTFYVRSGTILLSMFAHGAWDYLASLKSGTTVETTATTGGAIIDEGSLIIFIIVLGLVIFYLRPKKLREIDLNHFK
ncbi:CAAX amino protease [Lentilactobacillus fungorum]|uniref:CAAX amino protease n=1 Tax=Lentilactobacillus fungorum TaxID=2201250 RepID=A0ABQ3W0G4_9LACO|nr:CPBP family intramembrane glutamic endopeptidase [Lentilactobacillus fungorum]GHP13766.1 CAAX amino protease [Lentilactobacillus fungorum]